MKKSILGLIFLMATISGASAQKTDVSHSRIVVTLEGGTALFSKGGISYNVEILLFEIKKDHFQLYVRGGYLDGYFFKSICDSGELNGYHAGLTIVQGAGNHNLEMNFGMHRATERKTESQGFFRCFGSEQKKILPLFSAGYRYQRPGGGWVFSAKIGLMGLGVGVGYAF